MENDQGNSQNENSSPLDSVTNSITEQTDQNEEGNLVQEIVIAAKEREELLNKKNNNEYNLSVVLNASQKLDYFQTLDLPTDANEEVFETILREIEKKTKAIEELRQNNKEKWEGLKLEISEKRQELNETRDSFTATKEKVALQSVNSDTGERYTKEEVKDLLKKEDEAEKMLEYFQLEALKKRHSLNMAIDEKQNLVEGPLDYGEYEIMCSEIESNAEVIKQLKEEIRNLSKKSASVVNALSHLNQKLHAMQIESNSAEAKERPLEEELKGMRSELFKEKMKLARMNTKTEELCHKLILLQHPRLVEDYESLVSENDKHRKEIERLKGVYERLKKFILQ